MFSWLNPSDPPPVVKASSQFNWINEDQVPVGGIGIGWILYFLQGYKSATHFIFMNKIEKLPDQELKVLTIEVLTKLKPLAVESRL